ncbi:MAG: HemK2/MTQ2 family protein methyltransferase [Nitrososphaerales archaeon]
MLKKLRNSNGNNKPYRPSDDTFLLAESVEASGGRSALEVGAGSGYIAALLKERFGRVVATDISIEAIREAKARAGDVEFVCCDSASAISNARFDLIVMNPPYLPSDTMDDVTVDGGRGGIEVTLRMVRDSLPLLRRDDGAGGRMLIVTSSLADHRKLEAKIKEMGLQTHIARRKKLAFEELMVLEASFFTPYGARQRQSPSGESPSRP